MTRMNESFLQYVWQHRLLEGDLCTVDGQPVIIESPGLLNRDAGPDFTNARVWIGGTLWAGNIEVHVLTSDWNRHHHSNNRAYDNVVLHVVYDNDTPVTLQNCHTLPTIELKKYIPDLVLNNYEALVSPPTTVAIPCADRLAAVPKLYLDSTLDRLLLERLERKCDTVQRLLDESHGNWEQCCYWLLAHYFGGKTNSFPFELLAKSTDMNLLARWRDRPQRIEALLMSPPICGNSSGCAPMPSPPSASASSHSSCAAPATCSADSSIPHRSPTCSSSSMWPPRPTGTTTSVSTPPRRARPSAWAVPSSTCSSSTHGYPCSMNMATATGSNNAKTAPLTSFTRCVPKTTESSVSGTPSESKPTMPPAARRCSSSATPTAATATASTAA